MTEKSREETLDEKLDETPEKSIPGANPEEILVEKEDYYMIYLSVGNWLVLLLFIPSFAVYTAPDTALLLSVVMNFLFWAAWMKFAVRRLRWLFIIGLTLIMFVAPVLVLYTSL